ncbi:hypothetical protein [Haladaptatus salinisoli]|uniref:hypothetical protein n=1 Tax=Haladaptatus salinisoli TaxID=2884876 RepID=UPI001D0AE7B7|nr:hypothetical protein [Haladaptatus salinisoli]
METSTNRVKRRESTKRTMRALLGAEGVSFLLAAAVHAGILLSGYEHREAMLAESVLGTVLLVGLAVTLVRPRSLFAVAAGVQAFALLGTLVGIWTIIVGIGPRTLPDVVYHAVVVVALVAGLVLAWRNRGAKL